MTITRAEKRREWRATWPTGYPPKLDRTGMQTRWIRRLAWKRDA